MIILDIFLPKNTLLSWAICITEQSKPMKNFITEQSKRLNPFRIIAFNFRWFYIITLYPLFLQLILSEFSVLALLSGRGLRYSLPSLILQSPHMTLFSFFLLSLSSFSSLPFVCLAIDMSTAVNTVGATFQITEVRTGIFRKWLNPQRSKKTTSRAKWEVSGTCDVITRFGTWLLFKKTRPGGLGSSISDSSTGNVVRMSKDRNVYYFNSSRELYHSFPLFTLFN